MPILLIHGLTDTSIPFQQSEMIAAQNPVAIKLWKVPNAGHIGAFNAAGREFEARVLDWFATHRNCSGIR
ncbi:MAG: S9 family peptidase [Acidobacteriia bacterium]|nr:S9 family peptidase [Terriglobia bacterium]